MRIDKFLKVSRLVKRRTVAKEMADQIIPGNQEDGIAQYLQQFSH